jgi:hypothetical protein
MDPLFCSHRRFALLIDAENASASSIATVLSELAHYGSPIIRRAYGDWTTTHLAAWKKVLLEYAIQPMQQFAFTTGKNSTDGALIIDAMDLLYSRQVAGFAIVSSDSDFTRLCTRLREADMVVLGFGNRQTPRSFVAACHRFIYPAPPVDAVTNKTSPPPAPSGKWSAQQLQAEESLVKALVGAATKYANDKGWASISQIYQQLLVELPKFETKRYGYARWLKFLEATEMFVLEKQGKSNPVARLRRRLEIELPDAPEPLPAIEEDRLKFEESFYGDELFDPDVEQRNDEPWGDLDIPF